MSKECEDKSETKQHCARDQYENGFLFMQGEHELIVLNLYNGNDFTTGKLYAIETDSFKNQIITNPQVRKRKDEDMVKLELRTGYDDTIIIMLKYTAFLKRFANNHRIRSPALNCTYFGNVQGTQRYDCYDCSCLTLQQLNQICNEKLKKKIKQKESIFVLDTSIKYDE